MSNNQYIYDEEILETLEKMETGQLLSALIRYTHTLQSMILDLRKEVNELNPDMPYQDLHSDLYASFDDYKALEKYSDYIDPDLLDLEDE